MTQAEFVVYLRHRIAQDFPSAKAAAAAWHISGAYLSDVLQGQRKPAGRLLSATGFVREEVYTQQTKEARRG